MQQKKKKIKKIMCPNQCKHTHNTCNTSELKHKTNIQLILTKTQFVAGSKYIPACFLSRYSEIQYEIESHVNLTQNI